MSLSSQMMTIPGTKLARIPALDFTKGALVLIMVLYHWINYFLGPHDNRYLRFLTPSFIFISGFIISNVYIFKYGISDPQLPKRLIQRGFKILGVFLLLNLMRNFIAQGHPQDAAVTTHDWIRSLLDIYVLGSGVGGGQTKAVAFFILIPISYLLLLSAGLVVVSRYFRFTVHVVSLLFLLGIAISNYKGFEMPNLELLAIGLLGVIAGYMPTERVNAIVRHPYLLAAGYVAYLAAITVWNVIYPLQIIGVYLSLMILFLIGLQSGKPGSIRATVVLLGKYSLLGYIAQIAILQCLRLTIHPYSWETALLMLSFILAFALTIASIKVADVLRSRSIAVDRLYKFVFA
jgi:acyltransferase-like protein